MATALEAWLEAGRLLEHLPGLHNQKEHGRRFNVPGDPKSGLRKAAKKLAGGDDGKADTPRKRMSTIDTSTPHRADLAKRNVTDLRAEAKSRGLKPGKANKARLVDLIAEHEQHHGHGSVGAAVKHADDLSAATGRPPKSLNPAEVTGYNRRWWTALAEDTGMDPVPVRDLEIDGGYIVKSGKAYRIDGITFLVEDGAGASDAAQIVDGFRRIHRLLPPEADQYQQGYAWLAGRNPADGYWEQKYDHPGFSSLATAGDGAVRVWNRAGTSFGPDAHLATLMHEFGHNVSHAARDRDLHDRSANWSGAARLDAGLKRPTDVQYSGPMINKLRDLNFTRQRDRPYQYGVTDYGTSSPAEDYAESMALYLGDQLGTGRLRPGGPIVPIYFRDLFPARADVLDRVFPEIAKRQKAAISAR